LPRGACADTTHATTLLDYERPHWQSEAASLIAEGLLTYITVQLLEPDLDHDRMVDKDDHTDAQTFADRLKAHLLDYVDYRNQLPRVRRLSTH
jgi:hypothetical protein